MTTHILWPTFLWEAQHDPTIPLALAQAILPADDQLRSWADVRPWASDDLLHEDPSWLYAKERILEEAVKYADTTGVLYHELYITSMWVNAQYQRQNHAPHHHPNSLFSGVWYLDTPPGSQCFMMYDPRPASGIIKPRTKTIQGNISVAAGAGVMMMWPSWVQHSTQSITVDELESPRISLAFNIMLRDTIQDHSARINYL